MEDLRITIIQSSLDWEDIDANLKSFDSKISSIPIGSTDLIVLPEMFNTGFTMNASKFYDNMMGRTLQWMLNKAHEMNCVITGSLIVQDDDDDGIYYNRLIWMKPNNSCETYDKRHLFRMSDEHTNYTKGTERLIVELKGWKICPLICYDLRFPVWCRNRNDYDLLIFVANWPQKRVYAWKQLLIARAIENISYVIGVNRIGDDGNGFYHSGESTVLDYLGADLLSKENSSSSNEFIETITLSHAKLESFRDSFPAAMDADDFIIK
jgi:predicted amidohydrolase